MIACSRKERVKRVQYCTKLGQEEKAHKTKFSKKRWGSSKDPLKNVRGGVFFLEVHCHRALYYIFFQVET